MRTGIEGTIGAGERSAEAARRRGLGELSRAAIRRFRGADGTSHARALAYQMVFVVVSGFIGLVGLASVLDVDALRGTVVEMAKQLAPGPSGRLIQEAAKQGAGGASAAMVLGLGAALVAGTFAMAQLERSANRISGRREDRPEAKRYATALILALSAGVLVSLGLLVLGGGTAIATGAGWDGSVTDIWHVVRWPLGAALTAAGVFLLFRTAPRERIATDRGLAIGALVAVGLWLLFTLALALYFGLSDGPDQTYGSLLAVIALVLWAGAASIALHLGLAVAVELEGRGTEGVVAVPETEPTAARTVR